jgi:ribonuclease BN (tRNA processing enzyme)
MTPGGLPAEAQPFGPPLPPSPSAVELSITILGSGTGVPWKGRGSPGLVLAARRGQRAVQALIDPSAGSTHRMVARGYLLERLTHVLVTHFHPDHTGDLAPLLFALRNPRFDEVGRGEPLRLIGPPGLREFYHKVLGVYGGWVDLGARLRVEEASPASAASSGAFCIGPLEAVAHRVEHAESSVAYRFEARGGVVAAYSGDTDLCPGIIEAARGAQLLILECAFPEGAKHPGHLVPSEAGRIAAAAGVSRLVLTHFYPDCRGRDLLGDCRKYFSGELALAEDGMTINL